ncbi:hypothetical protein Tco_0861196 [Tanacetum coccineum]|uniref:Uncharacterized protein n=1 Tax=Tanacetum coccineum TaxID=301880 RepID=A0ABQ5BMS2_9ASTR
MVSSKGIEAANIVAGLKQIGVCCKGGLNIRSSWSEFSGSWLHGLAEEEAVDAMMGFLVGLTVVNESVDFNGRYPEWTVVRGQEYSRLWFAFVLMVFLRVLDGVTKVQTEASIKRSISATTITRNWKDVSDVVSRVKQIRIIDCEFMVVMGQAEGIHVVDLKAIEFKNHSSDNEESLGEDASKQGRIDNAYVKVTFIDETSNDARNKNNRFK